MQRYYDAYGWNIVQNEKEIESSNRITMVEEKYDCLSAIKLPYQNSHVGRSFYY
jgi:hypothetical protein